MSFCLKEPELSLYLGTRYYYTQLGKGINPISPCCLFTNWKMLFQRIVLQSEPEMSPKSLLWRVWTPEWYYSEVMECFKVESTNIGRWQHALQRHCGCLFWSLFFLPGYHEVSNSFHHTFSSKYLPQAPSSQGPACVDRKLQSFDETSLPLFGLISSGLCVLPAWYVGGCSIHIPWYLQRQLLKRTREL